MGNRRNSSRIPKRTKKAQSKRRNQSDDQDNVVQTPPEDANDCIIIDSTSDDVVQNDHVVEVGELEVISNNCEESEDVAIEESYDFTFISEEEYKTIDTHRIEVEKVPRPASKIVEGNRIVDLEYFAETCMELQMKHSQSCTLGLLKVHSERRYGLVSCINFQCNMCSFQTKCYTQEGAEDVRLQLNYGCVWSTLSGGTTHKTMTEFLSTMNIPPLSFRMYQQIELELADDWKKVLWDSMEEAGREEYENAVANNMVHTDGTPWIKVYLDGGWSHRSYGHNYNAASGVAVIIGKYSGKILFLGVRNKYCCVCARAAKKEEEPHEHLCFKNWSGSSGAMEADIIVEGFRESIRMHGVKYLEFIADGDSSVYTKIQQNVPYGREVRKISCKNHVIKNYGSALYKLKSDTTIAAAGRKYLTAASIRDLEKIATKVLYINAHGDVENLKIDLENGPHHVFGDHRKCKPSYCNLVGESSDKVFQMELAGIFHHIVTALQRIVVSQGHKLVDNETNNRAELFMSLLCKFNAGKRLNTIQKGSLQTRAYLSGLRYNKGADWQGSTWMETRPTTPGVPFQSFLKKCKTREDYDRKRRAQAAESKPQEVKSIPKRPRNEAVGYGPTAAQPALTDEEFESEKSRLLKRLQVTPTEISAIEENTVGQWDNNVYISYRMDRLTASNFGEICRRRPTTDPTKLVKRIIFPTMFKTTATEYGKIKESVARDRFARERQITVRECGLFIDPHHNYLGATPDGLVGEDSVVEIKCLHKVHKSGKTLLDFVKTDKSLCLEMTTTDEGRERLMLKKSHHYYYQVQGQLNISQRKWCFFITYVNDEQPLNVEVIERDQDLWNHEMLPKLRTFYEEHMIPELVKKYSSK